MASRWLRQCLPNIWAAIALLVVVLIGGLVAEIRNCGAPAPEPPVIRGVVIDTDGSPVAGAYVWADPGGLQCQSGPDGSFRVPVTSDHRYFIHALPDRASLPWQGKRTPVTAGEERAVLVVAAGGGIRCLLEDPHVATHGVRARLSGQRKEDFRQGLFDTTGRLELAGLPPGGGYSLYVSDEVDGRCALIRGIAAGGQELTVRLSEPKEIRGRVRMPEGAVLHAVWLLDGLVGHEVKADIDPAGSFVLRRVPDDTYPIQANLLLDGETLYASAEATPGTPVELEVHR